MEENNGKLKKKNESRFCSLIRMLFIRRWCNMNAVIIKTNR